ncbi:hypothetical protein P8C59_008362 [Phyllachora maydis]|uniref:Uncharacterized protein n=1 Tax=Phyllachora maydis TaxID=1825666 RepID=A0AAD9MF43_9PEZI|nr:hypothetical protein P8C59_008362 [Phyllachora maydis]
MDEIPTAIKAADINLWKCAVKGTQLHSVKPIMAYWCYYWVVNQILARQLHASDEEVLNYTTRLMDTLEQIKSDHANEEAITDDVAGQAYVENFSQDTLDRAERVVRANKVTHQTATTFDAAATFFHLVNIWGPADAETQQKIKYAKWNAARIAKALREGRDPNESNPRHDEEQASVASASLVSPASPTGGGGGMPVAPQPARVEDVPDAEEMVLPGVPSKLETPASHAQSGYFDSTNNNNMPSPESPPIQDPQDLAPPPSAPRNGAPPPEPSSEPAMPFPQHTQTQPPPVAGTPPPTAAVSMAPQAHASRPPIRPPSAPVSVPAPAGASPAPGPACTRGGGTVDEVAMLNAQKHAKWAISALNFEDVPTAVRELQKALELLGAT